MRAVRWAIVVAAVSLVVVAVAAAYAAGKAEAVPVADVVRAKRFEVVDSSGSVVAELRGGKPGYGALVLYGKDELGTFSAGGVMLLSAAADAQGLLTPSAVWFSKGKETRVGLTLAEDGSPSLSLSDEAGHVRAVLGRSDLVTARGGAAERTAESSLVLLDKDGKVLWQAP